MKKLKSEDVVMLLKVQALIKSACTKLYHKKENQNKKIRVGNKYITYTDLMNFIDFVGNNVIVKGGK